MLKYVDNQMDIYLDTTLVLQTNELSEIKHRMDMRCANNTSWINLMSVNILSHV